MAHYFPKIILIGKNNSDRRLKDLAIRIYDSAFSKILDCIEAFDDSLSIKSNLSGIARKIYETDVCSELIKTHKDIKNKGNWMYEKFSSNETEKIPIIITSDYSYLKDSNVIITASNSAKAIIFPEMLSKDKTVICDIAVPPDVDTSMFIDCDHVTVINGGNVKLPKDNESFSIAGSGVNNGETFGCAAETMIMGFSEINKDYKGAIEFEDIEYKRQLGAIHGFSLAVSEKEHIFRAYETKQKR